MTAGRPATYNSPEELQTKIDEFFECGLYNYTIDNLYKFLGFKCRQSFYDYKRKPEYSEVIQKAKEIINPICNKAKYNYKNGNKPNDRRKERLKLDYSFRLRTNISAQLRHRLKNKNGQNSFDLLDYTLEDLKKHLESKFENGMTWENYGKWHLDHIIPACSFKYDNHKDEDFKKCWSLDNLQPLWAVDNLKKGSRHFFDPKKRI